MALIHGVATTSWRLLALAVGSIFGWAGALATVLGLASDVGTPWQNFLAPLVLAFVVLSGLSIAMLVVTSLLAKRFPNLVRTKEISLQVAAKSIAILSVLGVMFVAQKTFADERGLLGANIKPVSDFQDAVVDRLSRLEDAIDVLTGQAEVAEKKVDELTEDVASTKEQVGELKETLSFSAALQILDRARQVRDGSNQGQTDAITALLSKGYDFVQADLSGISLRGGVIAGANFQRSKLYFSDLRGLNAENADLSMTELGVSLADNKTVFDGANLSNAFSPFFKGQGTSFRNANLSNANFFGADLRNADFSEANLSGAAFAFADLEGASFENANLTGAHFVGAILLNIDTSDAILDETNIGHAVLSLGDERLIEHSGVCSFVYDGNGGAGRVDWFVRVDERWKSDKFRSGYEYRQLNKYQSFPFRHLETFAKIRRCQSDSESANGYDAKYPLLFRVLVEREYTEKSNRRQEFRERYSELSARLTEAIESGRIAR